MTRRINVRQIEAFKAVIENGSISRAAEVFNISQPAMSKMIAHLEADTNLNLFDRFKGRLAPTAHAMRLYNEVERIFGGVRQVENAIDAIRREGQGRLAVGVMPALGGSFIQRVTSAFLDVRPNTFCVIHSLASPWIVERVIARRLDVGLVSGRMDNPLITLEPLMEQSLVCVLPHGHPLCKKKVVSPTDLHDIPFVSFDPTETHNGYLVDRFFASHGVTPRSVIYAATAPTVCEFVASGLGPSLVHPLMVAGYEDRLAIRRFEPTISYNFQLCRVIDNPNSKLVKEFSHEVKETANIVYRSLLEEL